MWCNPMTRCHKACPNMIHNILSINVAGIEHHPPNGSCLWQLGLPHFCHNLQYVAWSKYGMITTDTEGMGAYSGISSFAASEAPGVPQNFRPCGWSALVEAACENCWLYPEFSPVIDVQYKVWHRLANAVAPWHPLVFDCGAFQTLA